MGTSKFNAGGNPMMDYHHIKGGVEILLVASCYRNWDKFWPDRPLGSFADLTFTCLSVDISWMLNITVFSHCYFFSCLHLHCFLQKKALARVLA